LGEALLENYTKMFGNTRWREKVQAIAGSITDESLSSLEGELSGLYRETLLGVDPSLVAKLIPLRFSVAERTIYYLYLTTHDATGALQMNEVLHKAHMKESNLRLRLSYAREEQKMGTRMLFDPSEIEMVAPKRPSKQEVASDVHRQFQGQTVLLRQIYATYAISTTTDYFASEIQSALRSLRTEGKANYPGTLRNDTLIEFTRDSS
jgi:hypothetical protein